MINFSDCIKFIDEACSRLDDNKNTEGDVILEYKYFLLRLAAILGSKLLNKTLKMLHNDNSIFLSITSEEGDKGLFIYGVI